MKRKLIKGAWVVSMDPALGDIRNGEVLIEGRTIAAVGRNLAAGEDVEVIDAAGCIVKMIFAYLYACCGLRSFISSYILDFSVKLFFNVSNLLASRLEVVFKKLSNIKASFSKSKYLSPFNTEIPPYKLSTILEIPSA